MSVIFLDAANGGDGATKWDTFLPGSVQSGISASGRDVYRNSTNAGHEIIKQIPATTSVLTSWKGHLGALPQDGSTANQLFMVRTGTTVRLVLCILSDGSIRIRQTSGGGTIVATSAAGFVSAGTWHHYEFRAVLRNDASGRIEVWVDGSQAINFTGSTASGIVDIDNLRWGRCGSATNWDLSDFAIADETTNFGVTQVWDSYPNGAGTNTNLSQSPGTGSNWEKVDEKPPNGDTDYVFGDTEGQYDTYALSNLPSGTWSVFAVQTVLNAKKADAGDRFMRPVLRSGGVDYPGATVAVAESYASYLEVFDVDPDTSSAWTQSGVNALEAGPEIRDS